MSRSQLRVTAVILAVLIVVVGASALDRLPASVRGQIDAERKVLAQSQAQLGTIRGQIQNEVRSQPELFAALPFGTDWPNRFSKAEYELRSASSDVDELTRLEKHNRHSDKQAAESLLAHEKQVRAQALADASGVEKDASHWIEASNHIPDQIPVMERNYQAIHSVDLAPVTAAVQKAETDWPEKKADLDARLASVRSLLAQADSEWQTTADERKGAASGKVSGADAAALLAAEDSLQSSAATLSRQSAELKALTGQLYNSWDKVLVDMQHGRGDSARYEQKIRTVRTHITDPASKTGDVTSDETWTTVSKGTYDAEHNDLGMAIEHKAAGKYDSEADHVAQPAGMAYVAPPSQGSNQYGYWDHRDGHDFWVFYGQYALMRDLLFNHYYRPLDRYEWEDYRNYQSRGQTYYGHDSGSSAPKYGSYGSSTQNRYSSSNYAHSGGFRDSQYASKPGGYRSSQYSSPSVREPNADHGPKVFGHSAPEPHVAPPPRTYRPAPSRPPMRSPGRSFGRRR